MKDFTYGDFINEEIEKFYRQQTREKEKALAKAIENYDFIVGSKDVKGTLETSLPEGANIIYSPYIEDSTSVYMIKKFDMMDFLLRFGK